MTSLGSWKKPSFLKPGDTIIAISPSGAIKDTSVVEKEIEIVTVLIFKGR